MLLPPAQDFLEAELDVKRGLCLQPENADLHVLSKRLKVREGWCSEGLLAASFQY